MTGTKHITERDLAAAWNDGLVRGPYAFSDGRTVEIVHRGKYELRLVFTE